MSRGIFAVKKKIKKFKPRPPDAPDGTWRMQQEDIDRVQEFRKCIECFLCQDVCHVLRDHRMHDKFIGPRFLIYAAALEMHPLDTENRVEELREAHGIGYCNITKCCTKVCPERYSDHRQWNHSAEGTRGGSILRSVWPVLAVVEAEGGSDALTTYQRTIFSKSGSGTRMT